MRLPPPSTEAPWRDDAALDPFRHPDLPDDIEVRFYFWRERRIETMWVSLRATSPAVDGYFGELLNQAHTPDAPAKGSTVYVRIAPGCPQPIWVSPEMGANRARWNSECTACGFDMLPMPAEELARQQFPDAPEGCVPVKFTTRCPMCRETMIVDTRV